MNDLEKLIADSIAQRDERRAAELAAHEAEEARYEALFQSLLAEAAEALKPQIPAPLHPYIRYTYGRGAKDTLDARTWRPTMFHIQEAPGLGEILVSVNWKALDKPEINNITSGDDFDRDEWADAIAAAFDRYHARRAEYSRAAMSLG